MAFLAAPRMAAAYLAGRRTGRAVLVSMTGILAAMPTGLVLAATDLLADAMILMHHLVTFPFPALATFALARVAALLNVPARGFALSSW